MPRKVSSLKAKAKQEDAYRMKKECMLTGGTKGRSGHVDRILTCSKHPMKSNMKASKKCLLRILKS